MAGVYCSGRRNRREWQSLIARAERSPLSVRAFCAAQGVSTASFYLWRKRLGGEVARAAPPGFLELVELGRDGGAQEDHCSGGGWELELALGDGLVVRLRRR